MTTLVEKRNHTKFCEFHGEVGHNINEWKHLKKQIEEMLKAEKLSHLIRELKQNSGKEQPKTVKKGETSGKDKALAILLIQPWERVARQKITQSFSPNTKILFPHLDEDKGTESTMIIEAEIGGHCIHRMYVDGGSASEILYEHCFNRLRLEIKNQLVSATTPLIGFSDEIIWPIGEIQVLKTRSQKITSSSVNGSWNVEAPSRRRSNYPKKQQVGSPGMRVGLWTRRDPQAPKPMVEERLKVAINLECPKQTIMISSTLTEEGRNKLCNLLQRNLDIFAWKPADMTGVPRHIAEHRLNVWEECSPVRQKKKGQAADKNQAIQEVGKLMEAGIMKEVHYHDWLSNPVMVKNHDDSWRMCVDFKDLNKACPKDGYPLPEIDWKMPFGLRNARATYQRLVDKVFHKQIGRYLEVYVDDLVIKSCMEDEIVRDIEETFKTLREINMKLNPKKCTFGVEEGMFLGYKVNTKGLKVCPDKVDAVLSLPSPKCLKDVQKLNEKLASLNKFLAKSAEKSLPFFKTLKKCTKKSDFHWTTEAEKAFKQMKKLISELPMLTLLMEKRGTYRLFGGSQRNEEESPNTLMEVEEELPEPCILFTNGSSYTDGSGAGLILTNLEGMEFTYALRFRFDASNNKAEYEDLIAVLRIAEQMAVKYLRANVDSRLVANQVNGTYVAKEVDMIRYLEKVRTLANSFKAFSIRQVPRSGNKKVDALSKIASTSFAHLSKQVLVEELKEKSIGEVEVLAVVEEERDTWMTPIFEYLTEETLPADVKKKENMHAGTRSVIAKALRTSYYWPTMHKDARSLIRACQDCQVHKPVLRNPQKKLTLITSPWPFYKYGIDIAEPFPKGPRKVKFLIVRTPKEIISDNGKKFQDNPFKDCLGEGIKARLDASSKNWMEELSRVLWTHRTMIKSSNKDTLFSLTYGIEAVIPAEIGMPILRTAEVDLGQNNEALEINLDLLEEKREQAAIRKAKSKEKMEKYYNSKVQSTSFKPGDFVYHSINASRAEYTGKLGPKWEGPYKVTKAL
ncbi:reverse transcriptase domain-containing protein [Tanacetum coccineum]